MCPANFHSIEINLGPGMRLTPNISYRTSLKSFWTFSLDKSTIRKAAHGIQVGAQIYVLALSFLMIAKTSEKFSQ